MSDKPHPDDPRFDWLYGGQGSQEQPDDPDSTQVFPGPDAPHEDRPTEQPADQTGSEPTRILETPGGQRQDPPPAETKQSPPSFGGTYAAPQRSQASGQRSGPTPRDQGPPAGRPGRQAPTSPGTRPGLPPAAGPPAKAKKRRNWWVRGVLLLILAWIAFLVLVPVWAYSQVTKVDAEPAGERPTDTSGTTYLLVGSDSRENLTDEERAQVGAGDASGGRTDTILLLHVPDGDGPNLMLSIPRDSFVTIPGRGENKINAAYAFGGPELLVQTVESNTGVHVDNYIELGFSGFVELVDAVGGVEVCPRESIDDPKAGGLQLEEGCQEIDGATALGYSRSRAFANGDISRAEHQREVITSVGSRAASWQSIVLPWRYWSLNMAAADTLRVGENVGPIDLARFAWAMSRTGGGDTKRCVVPYSDLGASTSAGSSVIWDEQRANAVFEGIRDDDTASIECAPR